MIGCPDMPGLSFHRFILPSRCVNLTDCTTGWLSRYFRLLGPPACSRSRILALNVNGALRPILLHAQSSVLISRLAVMLPSNYFFSAILVFLTLLQSSLAANLPAYPLVGTPLSTIAFCRRLIVSRQCEIHICRVSVDFEISCKTHY